jgi:DNA-binding MarR family transcriptional regulator
VRRTPALRRTSRCGAGVALTLLRDLGEQNQSDLPATLGMDPTNVVALLNELEADDLVQRRRSPQDRRRHTVSLTTAGRARLKEVERLLTGVSSNGCWTVASE